MNGAVTGVSFRNKGLVDLSLCGSFYSRDRMAEIRVLPLSRIAEAAIAAFVA